MRFYESEQVTIYHGDNRAVMAELADCSFDAIVTDPPAGIAFMGREWDDFGKGNHDGLDAKVRSDAKYGRNMPYQAYRGQARAEIARAKGEFIAYMSIVMAEAHRLLKPGGHALVWAFPRTSHWTATAIEDAGFEVRDVITHHFGSGFPKSLDVSKAIDKASGVQREKMQPGNSPGYQRRIGNHRPWMDDPEHKIDGPIPITPEAAAWQGWGTALKPASEHWILARKPLSEASIAANVLRWGTGGIAIDNCRVPTSDDLSRPLVEPTGWKNSSKLNGTMSDDWRKGRWPANLILSHDPDCDGACVDGCPIAELDRQSGQRKAGGKVNGSEPSFTGQTGIYGKYGRVANEPRHDTGSASRFFPAFHYCAKASRRERDRGMEQAPTRMMHRVNPGGLEHDPRWAPYPVKNDHPTVKSLALMRWLVRLITPPGGLVLDMFAGSGSTALACRDEGFRCVLIDSDEHACEIAAARLSGTDGEVNDAEIQSQHADSASPAAGSASPSASETPTGEVTQHSFW